MDAQNRLYVGILVGKMNMGFACKVIADSIGEHGVRLTTMQLRYPRMVLAEFNTHRVFSRNTSSSRAIPVARMISNVFTDPYIPQFWGSATKGMQPGDELERYDREMCEESWLGALDNANWYSQCSKWS